VGVASAEGGAAGSADSGGACSADGDEDGEVFCALGTEGVDCLELGTVWQPANANTAKDRTKALLAANIRRKLSHVIETRMASVTKAEKVATHDFECHYQKPKRSAPVIKTFQSRSHRTLPKGGGQGSRLT
jgi:hypothetical protein